MVLLQRDHPMAATLAEVLPVAAARHGERTALVVNDRRLSFNELDALSNRVASGLVDLGVRPGDRVGLFGTNSYEWVVAYYGIAKTGAVLNPLSSMLTADELRYTVADAGARVVIGSADKAGQLRELKTAGALDHMVLWGTSEAEDALTLDDWLSSRSAEFIVRTRQPWKSCAASSPAHRLRSAVAAHAAYRSRCHGVERRARFDYVGFSVAERNTAYIMSVGGLICLWCEAADFGRRAPADGSHAGA